MKNKKNIAIRFIITLITLFWLNLTIVSAEESKVFSKYQLADVEDVLESANDLDNHFFSFHGFTGGDAITNHFSFFNFKVFSNKFKNSQAKTTGHANCDLLIRNCIWRI